MTNVMTMRKHLENMISEHKSHMDYAVSNNLPDMYEVCEQTIHYLSKHPVMQEGELTADDWNNANLHTQAKQIEFKDRVVSNISSTVNCRCCGKEIEVDDFNSRLIYTCHDCGYLVEQYIALKSTTPRSHDDGIIDTSKMNC